MKTKKDNQLAEYIKASRRGSREAEIENHGRPVSYNRVHVSKKVYNRKRTKADDQRHLPFPFYRAAVIPEIQFRSHYSDR